ncbi:hypothetical protein BC374_01455 [Ensifer sp. LC13]|nr:hypothetical protein BC374_01455 [Ensifer sp. LC13]OCP10447.1 hypothetical protein BBX50_01805 [Ensifer sp. LC11]OCP13947.1 hypothetical protein BC362_04150 [Ensifer sp. LC14]OCP32513.1 hypothetical protein BC364_01455 [Ensifer sp. LC499]
MNLNANLTKDFSGLFEFVCAICICLLLSSIELDLGCFWNNDLVMRGGASSQESDDMFRKPSPSQFLGKYYVRIYNYVQGFYLGLLVLMRMY